MNKFAIRLIILLSTSFFLSSAHAEDGEWCASIKSAHWPIEDGWPKSLSVIDPQIIYAETKNADGLYPERSSSPAMSIYKQLSKPSIMSKETEDDVLGNTGDIYYFHHMKETGVYFYGETAGPLGERFDMWAKENKGILEQIPAPFGDGDIDVQNIGFGTVNNTPIILAAYYTSNNGYNLRDGQHIVRVKAVQADPATWKNVCDFQPTLK